MKAITTLLAAIVLMVGSAFAQDKVELNGSYQFLNTQIAGTNYNSNPGWNASATIYVKGGLGIVTDWSGTDFAGGLLKATALNTGAGGLQYQFNRKGVLRPYVNVLVGDAKYTTAGPSNAFEQQLGAGADLSVSKHFALRGGVQYMHVGATGIYGSANNIAPIAGVTFRF